MEWESNDVRLDEERRGVRIARKVPKRTLHCGARIDNHRLCRDTPLPGSLPPGNFRRFCEVVGGWTSKYDNTVDQKQSRLPVVKEKKDDSVVRCRVLLHIKTKMVIGGVACPLKMILSSA